MKLLIKGIEVAEDAQLCVENGVDGIIVSNHGGRAEESGRATVDCLPEVFGAVKGRIPVMIDGGFRRGTDIFQARFGRQDRFHRPALHLGFRLVRPARCRASH